MSRTKRTKPEWAIRWSKAITQDRDAYINYRKFSINRNKWLNGYDGVYHDIGMPRNNSPRGYDRWDEVGRSNRRWAKRGAAKVIRRRFKKEIAAILRESGDFSVA